MGTIGCPKTSVRNHHYLLRNSPEERSSHLLRGGSLKPGSSLVVYWESVERDRITKLRKKKTAHCVLQLVSNSLVTLYLAGKTACSCELALVGKQKSVLPHSPPVNPLWSGLPAHLILLIAALNLLDPFPSFGKSLRLQHHLLKQRYSILEFTSCSPYLLQK